MRNESEFRPDLRVLNEQTLRQIERDIQLLRDWLVAGKPVSLRVGDEHGTEIALPVTTVELIRRALEFERNGKSFLLLETEGEVSLEQAAEMLRISHPTLLKKLESGEIPFQWSGSDRRISLAEVLAYRNKQQERTQAALRQMRDEADELGLYE
jgi:excisionase family DNA binding protein